MPWANPFRKRVEVVLELTTPPEGTVINSPAEALSVGLLMRARVQLYAMALLADRMLAGTTDPLARAIMESAFVANWMLDTPDAVATYVGQHRQQWTIIARERRSRNLPVTDIERQELWPFLEPDPELPPPARMPTFKDMAAGGEFSEWHTVYRMITRRAHPNFDAAMSRLVWNEEGVVQPVAGLTSVELGDPYIDLCAYIVARLGLMIDERLGWGGADGLRAVIDRMRELFESMKAVADADEWASPVDDNN